MALTGTPQKNGGLGWRSQLQHGTLDEYDDTPKMAKATVVDKGTLETVGGVTGRKYTTKETVQTENGTKDVYRSSFISEKYDKDAEAYSYSVEHRTGAETVVEKDASKPKTAFDSYWEEKDAVDTSQSGLQDSMVASTSGASTGLDSGATATESVLNNAGEPAKSFLKKANKADKKAKIQKKDIYPSVASGTVVQQYPSPENMNADYYRFGKYNQVEVMYDIPPKQFFPIVNDKVASSIRVIGQDAKSDKPADLIPAYTKFILESVQESHTERSQIVETFGDFYVFMFGERPPVYNFTGQLVNSRYTNWVTDFMYMYNEFLRGTRCVERNAKVLLTYGGRQIEGLILNTASQTNASIEGAVGFTFSVVVFERRYYSFSEDMGYYTTDNKTLIEDATLRKTLGLIAPPDGKGTSDPSYSDGKNALDNVMKKGAGAMGGYGPSNIATRNIG